jgi:hypothetical protein
VLPHQRQDSQREEDENSVTNLRIISARCVLDLRFEFLVSILSFEF